MVLERKFQPQVIKDLKQALPGCIVIKNDPTYIQGFPDLLVLYDDKWAALEVKTDREAPHRPNQEYYVEVHNLSVTEILSDPYIEFKAVDEKGELWYGLLAGRKDKYINISNLTVAFPASMYNPHTSNIDKNGYFDVTAVLHELKKNMKNTITPEKARDCGVLYKKIRQALNEL